MSRTTIVPLRVLTAALVLAAIAGAGRAQAQSLGTFTWQLQPYCNVVTVTITQVGGVYAMDGYDDQCGGPQRAPLVGVATPNPDGTVRIGWHIVLGSAGLHVGARIALDTLGGAWSDSADNAGTLAFGGNTGGAPRPPLRAIATIPPAFALQADGGFLAGGALNTGAIPASGAGTRMMWHPAKGAFRAGGADGTQWDDFNVGLYSTAMGFSTTAIGAYSTAMGGSSIASGEYSTAIGFGATASGPGSIALGRITTASGIDSTATGLRTTASGDYSAAFGNATRASGEASVAMGVLSVASGLSSLAGGLGGFAKGMSSLAFGYAEALTNANGSFVWGDLSTSTRVQSDQPGQFIVRAAGGVRFATNPGQTTGVILFPNASAWSVLSDASTKENFRDLVDEEVLTKIATMPVREWNYIAQGAAIRHLGPTAQDFHAAFGLGEDPRRISTIDADGVALAAARALEARTRETNERLTRELDTLREALAEIRREVAALKAR